MTWLEIILFIAALIFMFVGLLGVILPVLPGIPLIFGVALVFSILTDFTYLSGQTIIIMGILAVISLILDWIATLFGVKRMGGSKAGIFGAFIGMIVGLFIPGVGIFGFVIGAFVGAFIFELMVNRESKKALKAGLGSFIGFLVGGVLKLVVGAVMIGMFIWHVLIK
ncbi:MAG: DUF456 domain-containing protein [Candidatus Zixiibacteriota bacterium]|nr:MAG: DUF456 domain-containing protein [candidate division Zixibacteria bacterium]